MGLVKLVELAGLVGLVGLTFASSELAPLQSSLCLVNLFFKANWPWFAVREAAPEITAIQTLEFISFPMILL